MKKETFVISGMHCASCATLIKKSITKVPGVVNANVNFALEKAEVEFNPQQTSKEQIKKAINDAGNYKAMVEMEAEGDRHDHAKMLAEEKIKKLKDLLIFSLIFVPPGSRR